MTHPGKAALAEIMGYARRPFDVNFVLAAANNISSVAALVASLEAENKRLRDALDDKVDGLEADLQDAVTVAFSRGAEDWTKNNYPKLFERLVRAREARAALGATMANIVERLRGHHAMSVRQTMDEAADEIERAELAEAKAATEAAVMAERERCARIGYVECAKTRHVTLGDKVAAAIRGGGNGA